MAAISLNSKFLAADSFSLCPNVVCSLLFVIKLENRLANCLAKCLAICFYKLLIKICSTHKNRFEVID